MKRFIMFIVVALAFLAGCAQPASQQPAGPNETLVNTSNVGTVPSAPGSFGDVQIKDLSFNPQNLTIGAGTTVRWTNLDSAPHTISSTGNFDSGTLATGQSFAFKFDTPGTYDYQCNIHPFMKGQITVK